MQISATQRKQQGAVFTTAPDALVNLERDSGHSADPSVVYWEDSVGGGALAIAIILAMYVDTEHLIQDDAARTRDIFERRIFMNDVDGEFVKVTHQKLIQLSKKLAGDENFSCKINILQADTIDPDFDPCLFWGITQFRTITNRSYEQVSKLLDATSRDRLRDAYQDKIYPNNRTVGKRFKVTDIGQYKAIHNANWIGGVDIRPKNIPASLQAESIKVIDFRDSVRTMFSSATGASLAGIDVVIIQYANTAGDVEVRHGCSDTTSFMDAKSAWCFYNDLITHDYSDTTTDVLLAKLKSQLPATIGDYCVVSPSGVTLGAGDTIGDRSWRDKLISQGLEPAAFIKHLPVGAIQPGGFKLVPSKEYMLLPTSNEPVALNYFYSLFKNDKSSHRTPADKKAAYKKWIAVYNSAAPVLLLRYSADFSANNNRGLAVGYADALPGIGITGSVGFALSKHNSTTHLKALVAILHSTYGNFLKGVMGNQHNEQKTLVQGVSSKYKDFPVPDLTSANITKLVTIGEQIIKSGVVDITVTDAAVYKLLPCITKKDQQAIADYVINRRA